MNDELVEYTSHVERFLRDFAPVWCKITPNDLRMGTVARMYFELGVHWSKVEHMYTGPIEVNATESAQCEPTAGIGFSGTFGGW